MPRNHRTRLGAALVLLTALLLGYAAHGWHHLSDPACDQSPGSHPCVACSALHGSVLVGEGVATLAPTVCFECQAVAAPESRAHSAAVAGSTRPRAPPAA